MKKSWKQLSDAHRYIFSSRIKMYQAAYDMMEAMLLKLSKMFGDWATYEIKEILDANINKTIDDIYEELRQRTP
jgi:hypothetical protein